MKIGSFFRKLIQKACFLNILNIGRKKNKKKSQKCRVIFLRISSPKRGNNNNYIKNTFLPHLWFFFFSLFLIGALIFLSLKSFFFPKSTSIAKPISGFEKLLPTPYPYPFDKKIYVAPQLSATSALVLDANSAVVLYQKNPDLRLPPASTTKMMTAIVALDSYDTNQIFTADLKEVEGNSIKFLLGEQLTVESLLHALLISSANDAALILAKNYPGGESAFVEIMNKKAEEIGLKNTHFTNPVGYDDENHYSSARDLALLARILIQKPLLFKIVSLPATTISDVTGTHQHYLKNTNILVGKDGIKGIKTGWTQKAKECLVSWVEKNGQQIVIVLLESNDRFGETRKLIDWVFNNFEWKPLFPTSFTEQSIVQ